MEAPREELGNHYDAAHAPLDEYIHRAFQIGPPKLEKSSFDVGEPAGPGQVSGNGPHRLISGFDPGTMGEDYIARHARTIAQTPVQS